MTELKIIFDQFFHHFSDETVALFSREFTRKELKKGEYFLREGRRCDHLAFIIEGAMMCYYNKDGKRFIVLYLLFSLLLLLVIRLMCDIRRCVATSIPCLIHPADCVF